MTALGLDTARLAVVFGSGGVGKTTVAAALAARAAHEGRRVLLLTVDPARRLASVLAVPLGDAPVRIPLERGGSGELSAAMLESGASFDALLDRIVEGEGARAAIRKSAVYRGFSRTLARSHAYAALERIFAATLGAERAAYDLVVLDTPPGAAGLELCDAPGALARFAEDRVVTALTAGAGTPLLLGVRALFTAIAGATVARELAAFLGAFLPARAGFAERARAVEHLLRDVARRYFVVALDGPLREGSALYAALTARGLEPHATIANRVLGRTSPPWDRDAVATSLGASTDEARALSEAHALGAAVRAADARRGPLLSAFADATSAPIVRRLSRRTDDPTGIAALLDLLPGDAPRDEAEARR